MTIRGAKIDTTLGGRPTCYACLRPSSHCVCSLIAPFTAHCNILIIQHPNEWRKYYSTTKLVARALTNSRVIRGIEFEAETIDQALAGQNGYLLFPSKDAQDCEAVELDRNSTIVVIDGTWAEAGKIVFRNPSLKKLPCLSFRRPLISNYQIRKQPKEGYLSTIESVAHLLKLNAQATGSGIDSKPYDTLLSGFSQMVERQLNYFPRVANQIASTSFA